jgi:hypothetical protein
MSRRGACEVLWSGGLCELVAGREGKKNKEWLMANQPGGRGKEITVQFHTA